jgi:hypothetical protein
VEENDISFIDFIWADVQGAEEDLILGGLDTLRKRTKYLFTEYNNSEMYEGQINLNYGDAVQKAINIDFKKIIWTENYAKR